MPPQDERPYSASNAQRLERLVIVSERVEALLEQIQSRVKLIERVLWGDDNSSGLVSEHRVMYKGYVWLLCALSGLLGSGITLLAKKFF